MITAATYHSEAEMVAAYRAREERKRQAARRARAANENAPPANRPFRITTMPLWQRGPVHFDHHMRPWNQELLARAASPVKAYIMRRSRELGFPYEEIVGHSRSRPLCAARQLIMWEIKTQLRPGKQGERDYISYPEISRLFGGRDHTTVLHAVRAVQARKDMEGA